MPKHIHAEILLATRTSVLRSERSCQETTSNAPPGEVALVNRRTCIYDGPYFEPSAVGSVCLWQLDVSSGVGWCLLRISRTPAPSWTGPFPARGFSVSVAGCRAEPVLHELRRGDVVGRGHLTGVSLGLPPARFGGLTQRLGHASVGITLDTYSHVLPSIDDDAAAKVANLILGSGLAEAYLSGDPPSFVSWRVVVEPPVL